MAVAALAACGAGPEGATSVTLTDGSVALAWGDGEYGVVLVPGEDEDPADWAPLATEIAANGMTALAIDSQDVSAARAQLAEDWLTNGGIERVAFVTSGASGSQLLVAHARAGGAIDQLIAISAALTDDEAVALGEPPKLFVAAEEDGAGAEIAAHLSTVSVGTWNAVLLVPGAEQGLAILDSAGGDALIEGVVARLEERR
jgi:hypothetical protein